MEKPWLVSNLFFLMFVLIITLLFLSNFYRAIFEAIDKHSRTKHGYTSLLNVEQVPPLMKDEMPRSISSHRPFLTP